MTVAPTLAELVVPIESVRAYERNPRRGDLPAIKRSLEVNGQYRPVVVNRRTGEVLAGNHTWLAAVELGWEGIAATFVDVDEEQAKRIVLADNRTAQLGGFDDRELAELLASLPELDGTGFGSEDVAVLLASLEPSRRGDDTEPMAPPEAPRTRPGELYQLGEHRLLCGDATDAGAVETLLAGERPGVGLADPPYNVDEDYEIYDDDLSTADYAAFTERWFPLLAQTTARQIVTPGWNNLPLWCRLHRFRAIAAWTKSNAMTRGSISRFNTWEPILFFGEGWQTRARVTDVFDVPVRQQPGGTGMPIRGVAHPCPKPVELWADLVEIGATSAEAVFDPFCGAGTAVIAAENLGRRCYAMEIDPSYCDVIVDRWERHTGGKAKRGAE